MSKKSDEIARAYNEGQEHFQRKAVTALLNTIAELENETLQEYISRHRIWSLTTFGGGKRYKGLVEHIRKELLEILANPNDLMEWCDVIILAIDGAWREGYSPEQIAGELQQKQLINIARTWPKDTEPDKPTEHIKQEGD